MARRSYFPGVQFDSEDRNTIVPVIRRAREPMSDERARQLTVAHWFGCRNLDVDEVREALRRTGCTMLNRNSVDFSKPADLAERSREELCVQLPIGRRRFSWEGIEGRALGDNPMSLVLTSGGALAAQEFAPAIELAQAAYAPILDVATVYNTARGGDFPAPSVDDSAADGSMVAPNGQRDEDSMAGNVGRVLLKAYTGTSDFLVIPHELFEDASVFMDALPLMLGMRIGRLIGRMCTLGTGPDELTPANSQPTGLLTAATLGVTAASATAITENELLTLLHSVNAAYRNRIWNTGWMMHDNILLSLRNAKDGQGRYLYPSLQDKQPTLHGWPVLVNNSLASALVAEAKPILFGAFRKYLVRKVAQLRIARNVEARAEYDQECFVGYLRFDGNLSDTAAVKYLQMAEDPA